MTSQAAIHPSMLARASAYSGEVVYRERSAEKLTGSTLIIMLEPGAAYDGDAEGRAAARQVKLNAELAEVWTMGERDGQPTINRVGTDAIKRARADAELASLGDPWG